jgi:type IV secretory pathway VirB2 component (pilin)
MNYKHLIVFFILMSASLPAFAQPDDIPIPIPGQASLSDQLCELRQLFCGDAAVVIIGTMVFVVGLLFFSGRISWTFVMLLSTFAVVFISADIFREYITGRIDDEDGNHYRCSCGNAIIEIIDENE